MNNLKRNEQHIIEIWDEFKWKDCSGKRSIVRIIGVTEEQKSKHDEETIAKEIIYKNLTEL